jgi:hypothetical protein
MPLSVPRFGGALFIAGEVDSKSYLREVQTARTNRAFFEGGTRMGDNAIMAASAFDENIRITDSVQSLGSVDDKIDRLATAIGNLSAGLSSLSYAVGQLHATLNRVDLNVRTAQLRQNGVLNR